MAHPTLSDITLGYLMAERILQRKIFERLRDREGSKYFRNIVIKDIPWAENFGPLPSNFPVEFLRKYPTDFSTEYTTMGCNMLKCYKHDYAEPCKGDASVSAHPSLINDVVFKCSEACSGIYNEIFRFLREEYLGKNEKINPPTQEFPFETISIGNQYCGVQLTDLKTFAIHPSSRYPQEEPSPMNVRYRSGLVDAPPLRWKVDKQNVGFNHEYCKRFVKKYDSKEDVCYDPYHRVALGYIFGEKFIKLFPDYDFHRLPAEYLLDLVSKEQYFSLKVNDGYVETPASQEELERRVFTDVPDIPSTADAIIEGNNVSNNNKLRSKVVETSLKLNSIMIDTVKGVALDLGIEAATVQTPAMAARMLTYYTPKISSYLISNVSRVPVPVRLTCLLVRTVLIDFGLKATINALKCITSMASGVFAVGLITLVPDILMNIYNVGGYNNEITREYLDERRDTLLDFFLKQTLAEFAELGPVLNYLQTPDSRYVTPLITPEIVFKLGLINFVESNPQLNKEIGYNWVDEEAQFEIVQNDYLSFLTTNSLGQKIDYDNENTPASKETERYYYSIAEKIKKDADNMILTENESQKRRENIISRGTKNARKNIYITASFLFLLFAAFCWVVSSVNFIAFKGAMIGSIFSLMLFLYE